MFSNHALTIFVGSCLIQYFLIPPIITYHNYSSIPYMSQISIINFYISLLQGLFALYLEIIWHDLHYKIFTINHHIAIIVVTLITIYMYRNQIGINDKQFLTHVDESNKNDLLRSREIITKTNNPDVLQFAQNNIQRVYDVKSKIIDILTKIHNKKNRYKL